MFTRIRRKPAIKFLMGVMVFGWTLIFHLPLIYAQVTSSDVSPMRNDLATPLGEKSDKSSDRENLKRDILSESLYSASVLQRVNRKNVDALRTLQRAYRAQANPAILREILLLTNRLRLKNEFVRYAEFAGGNGLVDQKLILNAALALS